MRVLTSAFVAGAFLLIAPSGAEAQAVGASGPVETSVIVRQAEVYLPVSPFHTETPGVAVYQSSAKKATGTTLMIVGGAGLVIGGIIGGAEGALIAVAGVGVGAYGIYLFVND